MKKAILTFLGTGAAMSNGRDWTSILVNDTILMEVSPTTPTNLKKLKKDFLQIDFVFLSHYHGDHVFGIPFFLCEYAFKTQRNKPIHIIGPNDVKKQVESLVKIAYSDAWQEILKGSNIQFYSLSLKGEETSINGLSFAAIPMQHTRIDCLGYKLQLENINFSQARSNLHLDKVESHASHIENTIFAFSGDTELCSNLLNLIQDADLACLEMTAEENFIPGHMNLNDIKTIATGLSNKQQIFLVHLSNNPSKEVINLPQIIVPEDLSQYCFDNGKIRMI